MKNHQKSINKTGLGNDFYIKTNEWTHNGILRGGHTILCANYSSTQRIRAPITCADQNEKIREETPNSV